MNIFTGSTRLATLVFVAALASCGGSGNESGADPRVRLLNLSSGYSSLDLMTNLDSDEDDDDETQLEDVALESVSEYVTLDQDDYTIKLRRSGSGSVLRSFTGEELVEDTINTYVAYGEVGQFGALRIDESLEEADAGENTLLVANVSSAGALDIYLTEPTTDLDDTTPVLSGVGPALAQLTADSGSYRLRAVAAGDTSDVRLDIANFTLTDRGVGSLILTSTQGGMLANAVYLPQEGTAVTKFNNTRSRIRGAVALANGANASLQVNGTAILTATTAGVIASRYTLMDAGALPVSLVVNGAPVTVPNATLVAGADYTLMVWTDAAGPRTSLIVDDNRLPAGAGMTKLRVLNGMSTLASPITLSVDFSPIIEGTLLGQVSEEEEISAGTDRQFDITNTSTAAPVLTRTAITLQGNSVYTFFMTDNGGTPIGVLRRDR
jgi:hypothetical protein